MMQWYNVGKEFVIDDMKRTYFTMFFIHATFILKGNAPPIFAFSDSVLHACQHTTQSCSAIQTNIK